MSVTKRGNSWQVYLVVNGHKVRESYPTQAQAITREAALKVADMTGVVPVSADKTDVNLTLSALRDKVMARVWKGQKSESRSAYLSSKIVATIGPNVQVRSLDAKMIDRFIEGLEAKRNSNGTINRKLAVLSKMLHFAKSREYIDSVPHVAFKPAPKSRVRYLSDEEEAKVLALLKLWSCEDEHDLVVFLLDTGARIGEALKLTWHDVAGNFSRATFRDTKNGATRSVPLTQRVRYILSAHVERPHGSAGPFSHFRYHNVEILWRRVRQHLGLTKDKDFVLHALRHTCASRLVQGGMTLQKVMVWLGHSSITQTMQYAHLAPDSLDDMVAVLERAPTEKPRHLGVVEGGQSGQGRGAAGG
jgi:integrase